MVEGRKMEELMRVKLLRGGTRVGVTRLSSIPTLPQIQDDDQGLLLTDDEDRDWRCVLGGTSQDVS